MSQAVKPAAVDDEDDLRDVELSFAVDDGSSSDDDDNGNDVNNTNTEKLDENAVINCFNFSVNAHIKGKFEHAKTTTTDKCLGKDDNIGKRNMKKEDKIEDQSTDPSSSPADEDVKEWFPASLPLPKWAASD
jgi:hypothetical protein